MTMILRKYHIAVCIGLEKGRALRTIYCIPARWGPQKSTRLVGFKTFSPGLRHTGSTKNYNLEGWECWALRTQKMRPALAVLVGLLSFCKVFPDHQPEVTQFMPLPMVKLKS